MSSSSDEEEIDQSKLKTKPTQSGLHVKPVASLKLSNSSNASSTTDSKNAGALNFELSQPLEHFEANGSGEVEGKSKSSKHKKHHKKSKKSSSSKEKKLKETKEKSEEQERDELEEFMNGTSVSNMSMPDETAYEAL